MRLREPPAFLLYMSIYRVLAIHDRVLCCSEPLSGHSSSGQICLQRRDKLLRLVISLIVQGT